MNFLLIDTSYTIFYRYFATMRWYNFAHRDDVFPDDYDWFDNEIFKNMFIKKYKQSFDKIIAKYKIDSQNIIFIRDCSRNNIWRRLYDKNYKLNRDIIHGKEFKGGPFFKYVYETIILDFIKYNKYKMLQHNNLEADDIIYLTKNYIREQDNNNNIIIISSDTDLLQMIDTKTYIYNLQNKCINNKCGEHNVKDFLEMKIICGDKSDNIPGCFSKCGPKTSLKLIKNTELLLEKFRKNPNSFDRYTLNRILIDLNNIPKDLIVSCNKVINLTLT